MSAGGAPHEVVTLATDRVARLLEADRVVLFMADGERLRPRSARGFRRDDLESIAVRAGEGLVGGAYRQRRATLGVPEGDTFIARFPVREAIAVPVRVDDEVIGVLYAGRASDRAFTADDEILVLVAADRLGAALAQQALVDRRTAHIGRLADLARFAREVSLGQDVGLTLSRACEMGCGLLGVRGAAVAVGRDELEVVGAWGLPAGVGTAGPVSRRAGLTADVYAEGRAIVCRDVQAAPAERSFLSGCGFRGCLLVPLQARDVTFGVLYLADAVVRDFSADEIATACLLGAMVASAVDASGVHGELRSAFERAQSVHGRDVETEKARSLAEIARGIAREFNQIIAVILGKSQLLLARAPDEAMRDGLGVIEDAAWRGADLVRRIAGLAAPADARNGVVDVRAIAQDAIALVRTRWRSEGTVQGAVDIAADLSTVSAVRGDEAALREAVGHLLRNALDAMPGGGQLAIALRGRDGGVELVIEDTGEGLSEDVRRRMFDPFFTTRAPGRMGLGLTLVRSTIARSGGRVSVERRADRGTIATVWLPAAAATGAAESPIPGAIAPLSRIAPGSGAPASDPAGEAARPARASPSILVLEDEEPVRAMLVEALTRAGYDVHVASDAGGGLQKIEGGSFDAVLTDLALPERSGLAIARSVKRVSPETAVVLITGCGQVLDPGRLREHGVDLMLVKPFEAERAVSVVNDALRLRARSR